MIPVGILQDPNQRLPPIRRFGIGWARLGLVVIDGAITRGILSQPISFLILFSRNIIQVVIDELCQQLPSLIK